MEVNVTQSSSVWSQYMNIIQKSTIIESQDCERLSECKYFLELGHIILLGDSVNCKEILQKRGTIQRVSTLETLKIKDLVLCEA